jgi:hypothetical protein
MRSRGNFATSIGLALGLSLLLTPLGFETRPLSTVALAGMIGLGAYSAGFVLSLVSLVLTVRNKRTKFAATLGVAGQVLFYPIIFTDLFGKFSSLPAPPAIPATEVITFVLSLMAVFFALKVRAEGSRGKKIIIEQ